MTFYNSGFLLIVQLGGLLLSVFLCADYENVAINILSLTIVFEKLRV
jgi:hypothetical protein